MPNKPSDSTKPIVSAPEITARFGITQAELAQLTGVDHRAFSKNEVKRKLDEAVRPLARIFTMASEMTGSDEQAALWFKHKPIPGWAGKTAFDLVSARKADQVLAYLEAVQLGAYS
ncbi:antitoxin Xre/MbcA/ParS toxin-binding domain-containing protein [Cohaesibacter haloalkalitolerans]|uniref:antitoxin Xre/MbcA/ParS toxin-binding domain-containing protein n=1 Tax=Cohaesibacter haloalkalitolerans TaxID=1162980 RepID=UPI000E65957E|nr:antitoxin Xre/MbcA/ParS toxin-binding domain-containing protein [Cohaesibacter haloalkalitolerans]